jgi:hypothetical protein
MMRVLSVRFKSSTPWEELEGPWLEAASAIAAVPGLISKLWFRDGDVYGGVYVLRDQASLDAYAAGPIVAAIMNDPAFSDFRIEQYDVLEDHSAITHGVVVSPIPN